MGYIVVALAAVLIGVVAGFVLGKRSTRWCPICGLTMSIEHCPAHTRGLVGLTSQNTPAAPR